MATYGSEEIEASSWGICFQGAANGGLERASSNCTKNCVAFKFKAACHNCRKHDLICRFAERTAHIIPISAPQGSSNQGRIRLSNQLIKRASEQWNNRAAEQRNRGKKPTLNPEERSIWPELCHWGIPDAKAAVLLCPGRQEARKKI